MLYHYRYPTSQVVPQYYSDQYLALPAVDQYSRPVFKGVTDQNKGGIIMYGLVTTPGKVDFFSTLLHWVLSLFPLMVFCLVVYLVYLAYEWWVNNYDDNTSAFFKDGIDYYFQATVSFLTPGLLALTTMGWNFVEYVSTLRPKENPGQAQEMKKFMDKSDFVLKTDTRSTAKREAKLLVELEREGDRILEWVGRNKGADRKLRMLYKRTGGKCPPLRRLSAKEPIDKVAKNVGKGKEIHLRVLKTDGSGESESFETLAGRLKHELAHCAMPNGDDDHNEDFWNVLEKLETV
jgi:hypothetical protein